MTSQHNTPYRDPAHFIYVEAHPGHDHTIMAPISGRHLSQALTDAITVPCRRESQYRIPSVDKGPSARVPSNGRNHGFWCLDAGDLVRGGVTTTIHIFVSTNLGFLCCVVARWIKGAMYVVGAGARSVTWISSLQ